MKKLFCLMAVAMIAATSAFGQQKLFNATELNRAQTTDTVKVDKSKRVRGERHASTKKCSRVAQDSCRVKNACLNDSSCASGFGRQIKPAKKVDCRCEKKCEQKCEKSCEKKCEKKCEKAAVSTCKESCSNNSGKK